MRRIVLACALSALAVAAGTADARPNAARSWATPQIQAVVDAGFLGTSVQGFRPDDPLTWDVDVRGAGRLALTLREGREAAYLYRRLATLDRDAAAPGDVDDLEWRGVPREPFERLCARLGFESIPGRVHRWA